MSKIKKALFWNSFQSVGLMAVNILSLVILARLLTPYDYGIYGIMMIFVSMSELIADCGIGGYLIKKQNVTQIYYDTLFIFNMSVSVILYAIIYISAPLIADFYDNSDLVGAIRILGTVIIIQAFSITQRTRLLKNLEFRSMAFIAITASVCGLIVAFVLAYNGFSYWSLVWQNICFCLLSSILYLSVNRSIPHFRFSLSVFKEQFLFGINLFASTILQTLTNNISNNVIAKLFNIKITGLYSQANRIQHYPISIITIVIDRTFFPILSRQNENLAELRSNVVRIRRLLYAYLMPCFTLLICFAHEIILVVLGKQWVECTDIFQLLMTASYFMLAKTMNRSVLKSVGETFCILKVEIYTTIVFFIVLFASALLHNLYILISAVIISAMISMLYSMIYLKVKMGFDLSKQIVDFMTFMAISLIPLVTLLFDIPLWGKLVSYATFVVFSLLICKKYGIEEYRKLEFLAKGVKRRINKADL